MMGLNNMLCQTASGLVLNLILFLSYIGSSNGDNICAVGDKLEFCEYGCCNGKCCDMSTIAIVGAVIGGVLGLISIIACGFCIYHMCNKKKGRDTAVQPYNNNHVFVHNNTPYGGPQYGGAHPPPRPNPPPSYNQSSSYPPYNPGFDPAYPPGAVGHPPPAYSYSDPIGKK